MFILSILIDRSFLIDRYFIDPQWLIHPVCRVSLLLALLVTGVLRVQGVCHSLTCMCH